MWFKLKGVSYEVKEVVENVYMPKDNEGARAGCDLEDVYNYLKRGPLNIAEPSVF